MVKIGFYNGHKEIHLLGCHFKAYRARVWCISFFGQSRDVTKLRLLEHYHHSNRDSYMVSLFEGTWRFYILCQSRIL